MPLSLLPRDPHYVRLGFYQIEEDTVTSTSIRQRMLLCAGIAVLLSACASGPTVTTTQDVSASAKVPYNKVLVISLFSSFDSRRYLEKELVKAISDRGGSAVASTTMMDSRTPVTRETFVAMVDKIDADAVLITQMINLETRAEVKDMRPEATRNFRPTYYYNVWSYELAEYAEPQGVAFEYSLRLASQMLSVDKETTIWAIESNTEIKMDAETDRDYSIYVNEAAGIAQQMSKDGLIRR
jgi:hypothetical protein